MKLPSGPLYGEASVRELDRRAIEVLAGDGYALMTRAAVSVYRRLRARWPEAKRVLVLCGRGHNGGDGYVVARLAQADGLEVRVIRAVDEPPTADDGVRAATECSAAGVEIATFDGRLPPAEVIVDAIFGIGLARPPQGAYASLIEAANASGLPILAVDMPSGLHADTGEAYRPTIRADLTVTLVARKTGLYTGDAPAHTGALVLEALGVDTGDARYRDVAAEAALIGDALLHARLPPRRATAHKGEHGHVLVVGGDRGYGGAARLAAEAAARAGAGLVSVATRAEHVGALLASVPEAMVRAVDAAGDLARMIERAGVLAIGPGLGREAWGRALWLQALDAGVRGAANLVLDADALNLLADAPRQLGADTIVTPHPGEAARLLGVDAKSVQADRYAAARELARRYRCVVVLKGAGTIVARSRGERCELAVCAAANPALATGGTGDVLTGIVAALRAQGCDAWDAACLGVVVHARAGAIAAGGRTRGVLASDLAAALVEAVNPVAAPPVADASQDGAGS